MKNVSREFTSFNLYIQDESRFGLFTRNGKALTAKGVKPICTYQNIFKSTYVFGAFSTYNGDSLVMELPNCNGGNFTHILLLFLMVFVMCFAVQIFLNQLSEKNPEEFKVVILDDGAFHKGKALIVPKKYIFAFSSALFSRIKSSRTGLAKHEKKNNKCYLQNNGRTQGRN